LFSALPAADENITRESHDILTTAELSCTTLPTPAVFDARHELQQFVSSMNYRRSEHLVTAFITHLTSNAQVDGVGPWSRTQRNAYMRMYMRWRRDYQTRIELPIDCTDEHRSLQRIHEHRLSHLVFVECWQSLRADDESTCNDNDDMFQLYTCVLHTELTSLALYTSIHWPLSTNSQYAIRVYYALFRDQATSIEDRLTAARVCERLFEAQVGLRVHLPYLDTHISLQSLRDEMVCKHICSCSIIRSFQYAVETASMVKNISDYHTAGEYARVVEVLVNALQHKRACLKTTDRQTYEMMLFRCVSVHWCSHMSAYLCRCYMQLAQTSDAFQLLPKCVHDTLCSIQASTTALTDVRQHAHHWRALNELLTVLIEHHSMCQQLLSVATLIKLGNDLVALTVLRSELNGKAFRYACANTLL
jgi:hypothetical protein